MKRRYKTGTEKREEKRKKDLELAAKNPTQKKLSFSAVTGQTNLHTRDDSAVDNSNSNDGVQEDQGLSTENHCERNESTSPSIVESASLAAPANVDTVLSPDSTSTTCTDQDEVPVPEHAPSSSHSYSCSDQDQEEGQDIGDGVGVRIRISCPEMAYFVAPAGDAPLSVKKVFLGHHPIQPEPTCNQKLPFNPSKAYFKSLPDSKSKSSEKRLWLSYCKDNSSFYCTSCMAFAPASKTTSFVKGLNVVGMHDVYKRLDIHEASDEHIRATTSCAAALANKDIATLIDTDLANKTISEKKLRHSIVERITHLCIFIGRQGLAYRGISESASTLDDRSLNHGNFLELMLLISEFDPVLKQHIALCTEKAKQRQKSSKGQKGRGSFVTFFSKSSINKLIRIIGDEIQSATVKAIKEAVFFSLQIDSTTDVRVLDQLCITIRYVDSSGPAEKLFRLLVSHDNTGEGLFNLVELELSKVGLDLRNCVGCSFDGASNMSGCYKGLQARLKEANPYIQFTHCTAHCLNLVMSDCCNNVLPCRKLFGLVQSGAVFLGDSYKRMEVWSQRVKSTGKMHTKLRTLQKIGATRWWSKPKALKSVLDEHCGIVGFDSTNSTSSKFVDFMFCMTTIRDSPKFDDKAHFEADCISKGWTSFETLLTSVIMTDVFAETDSTSVALQSSNIDYLITFKMVESLLDRIKSKRDQFDMFVERAKNYANSVNDILEEEQIDLRLETDFKPVRSARNPTKNATRGRSTGTTTETEAEKEERELNEAKRCYEINTFYVIIDQIVGGLTQRFKPNEALLKDCATLDPKRFSEVLRSSIGPDSSLLNTVAPLAKVDVCKARKQLFQFAQDYDKFQNTSVVNLPAVLTTTSSDEEIEGEVNPFPDPFDEVVSDCDDDVETAGKPLKVKCELCKKCLPCAFKLFSTYPVLISSYQELYQCYKYVLTLPTTQVSCERIFSKVKEIKSRLRNSLSQELFEPLMFMSVERERAASLDVKKIVRIFASSSIELQRLLF